MSMEERREIKAQDSTPVLEPGHTFASITEKISSIVLTKKTPLGWFIGFAIAFLAAHGTAFYNRNAAICRCWDLGHQRSGWLGFRHHQFRLVDRHRSRWNINLCNPFVVETTMANFH